MKIIAQLQSIKGTKCQVGFDFRSDFAGLVKNGDADFLILATENGFSPLGQARGVLSHELDIPVHEIIKLADWNRFENPQIANVGLKPKQNGSSLKGAVLAACEGGNVDVQSVLSALRHASRFEVDVQDGDDGDHVRVAVR